eukprot:scaffold53082_cov36-Phaeocystis_antarctica.AAC.1
MADAGPRVGRRRVVFLGLRVFVLVPKPFAAHVALIVRAQLRALLVGTRSAFIDGPSADFPSPQILAPS